MISSKAVSVFNEKSCDVGDIRYINDLLDVAVRDGAMVAPNGGGSLLSKFTFSSTIRNKLDTGGTVVAFYSLLGFKYYLTAATAPSLGAKVRLAGYYKLFESISVGRDSVTVHALQYYVIRGENVASNYWNGNLDQPDVLPAQPEPFGNSAPGFTPFDKMPLIDGDEVVWCNVAIVRNPENHRQPQCHRKHLNRIKRWVSATDLGSGEVYVNRTQGSATTSITNY